MTTETDKEERLQWSTIRNDKQSLWEVTTTEPSMMRNLVKKCIIEDELRMRLSSKVNVTAETIEGIPRFASEKVTFMVNEIE